MTNWKVISPLRNPDDQLTDTRPFKISTTWERETSQAGYPPARKDTSKTPVSVMISTDGCHSAFSSNSSVNNVLKDGNTVNVISKAAATERRQSKRLSVHSCKNICFFPAPMVFRTPTSRARVKARATFRLMKLKQAMAITTIAMTTNMYK